MSKSSLYIDSDGVLRGYYVYVHKDRETGKVFYVGKGQGKRAWSKSKRHAKWQEVVTALDDAWEVEIVKDKLSELEAYDLEAQLVEQHGGAAAEGGGLTNWFPGGENPASVSIVVSLGPTLGSQVDVYYKVRQFKSFPRAEQEGVVLLLKQCLDEAMDIIDELKDYAEERENDALASSLDNLDMILGDQLNIVDDFLRRRISWQDFALGFEEMLDDLPKETIVQLHRKVQIVARAVVRESRKLFKLIDTGNRDEAERQSRAASRQAALDAGLITETGATQ